MRSVATAEAVIEPWERYYPPYKCIDCQRRKPTFPVLGESSPAFCKQCYVAYLERAESRKRATAELERHNYAMTKRSRSLIIGLLQQGELLDADIQTLRWKGAEWFGNWSGVGKVTVTDIGRAIGGWE